MAAVVKNRTAYAAELECNEADTRHWMHIWCVDKNGGKLADIPPILKESGLSPTVPNIMSEAAKKHASHNCMGVRPIQKCLIEGKKMFWQKGNFEWRTYDQVFTDIKNASIGLYSLPGIADKRMQKQQVVAAVLAETSQEWMISAQASLACGLTLTTVYATLGHDAMLHGLQQTAAEIIFMDWGLFDQLRENVLAKCPALRHIIFIGKDFVPRETQGGQAPKPFPIPPESHTLEVNVSLMCLFCSETLGCADTCATSYLTRP